MTDKRHFRLAPLDVATLIVLAAALYMFIRPGSALHAYTTEWLAFRRVEQAAAVNWDKLASAAQPLYAGSEAPQLVVFSDYECPFCRMAYPAIDSALDRGARIAMVQLPLVDIHPVAAAASRTAICAARVGKFREVDRWLMTTSGWRTDTAALRNSATLGIGNAAEFSRCVDSPEVAQVLQSQIALAGQLQVRATPTILSKGRILRGRPTTKALLEMAQLR